MWVLILTLYLKGDGQRALMHTVDGFHSEAACMVAAKEWTRMNYGESKASKALCVRKN